MLTVFVKKHSVTHQSLHIVVHKRTWALDRWFCFWITGFLPWCGN